MIDARLVANRFIQLARTQGRTLTPMQIIKLVYIAHGWKLGLQNQPLIRQNVEAWQYGPVIRDIYNSTRVAGRGPVETEIWAPSDEMITTEDEGLISQVYNLYGHLSGLQLSNITHMPNTPWASCYKPGEFSTSIPDPVIQAHYARLATERVPSGSN